MHRELKKRIATDPAKTPLLRVAAERFRSSSHCPATLSQTHRLTGAARRIMTTT